MAFQQINLGTPNDGAGDSLRDGGLKIEANFALIAGSTGADQIGDSGSVKKFTTANDIAKLAGIAAGAQVNPTGGEIKTAYEANANTNAFTDALLAKLNAIDATHYGAPLQDLTALRALAEASITDKERRYVEDELSDYFFDATAVSGEEAPNDQTGGTGFWRKVAVGSETSASIKAKYESNADTNAFTDAFQTKLTNIEANATADQTDGEIEEAYNRQIGIATQGELQFGSSTIRRYSPNNIHDAIRFIAPTTGAEVKTLYEGEANTNAFTDALLAKLNAIDAAHYGAPLQDLTALRALAEASITDKERRYVEDELSDYFYDATAASGDEAPTDQTGGTGFWRKVAVGGETSASIKTKYESNADTNAFTDALQSKLNAIEANATADQTGAEIKTAYEANADTNAFTDAEQTKLSGIAAGAQVNPTGAAIKTAYEGEANTNAFTDALLAKLNAIDAAHYGAPLQDLTALRALAEASITDKERRYVEDELSDYFYDATAASGDEAPTDQTGGTGFWRKVAVGGETSASIKTKYESNADTNAFTDAEQTKLSGIEAGAQVNPTGAAIKTAYEGEANTNAFTDALQSKLNAIEANATADQTDAEIKTAYEANANTNAFTDALLAKLNAIDAAHYGAPLQDLTALRALAEASITDKERRYVEDELSDYFYDATAASGDEAPTDQTGGTGFWRKVAVGGETSASIKTKYESNADTNAFTDAEQTKLSGIEAGAQVNPTGAAIKTAYEGEANTNAFTDALQSKLNAIEANATADQTDAEIKTAYEANANTNAFTDALLAKLNAIDAAHYGAPLQDLTALRALAEASITDKERRYVEDELSDYFYDATAASGDEAPTDQTGGTGFWRKVAVGGETSASIKTKYESNADTNAFTDAEQTKLSGIEAGAQVNPTGAAIKTAYEGEANTNAFTDALQSKLNAIEANATADQTGAEIKTAYEANADTNAFTDAEQTKLSGIAAGAQVNPTGAAIKTAYEGEANTNAFTDALLAKLNAIDAAHYGAPLQDLTALRALAEASITDKERRYVEDELSDYFYDATAASGDEAPTDQTGGTGFWRKVAVGGETAASIKTKYESNADTNAFTDAEQTKLSGIESNATADQTNAEIETAYNAQVAAASQAEAEAGTETAIRRFSPLTIAQAIAAQASPLLTPRSSQGGSAYTLALGDAGSIVERNSAAANTTTIPANSAVAFPLGTTIVIAQEGAGESSVVAASGVTLNGVSAGSAAFDARYAEVSIRKRGTNDWRMVGGHGAVA